MALQEPVPGQPLTATWGRDVVRELRSLRPLGGPGMRVTRGPNGVTIASTRKGGGGDASERVGQYPFRLAFRDVLESGVTKKYAVVYVNDGAVQKDGDDDVEVAEVANDEATGMEQGWFDVAEYFDDESGEQVTNDLATVIASSGGVKDVYALVYTTTDETFKVAVQMTADWPECLSDATQIDRYYIGSIQRTDSGSGSSAITTFSITNQALRSGVVATEVSESAEDLPRPWQMKFGVGASGTTGTDRTPLLVYCPNAYLDGVMATVDNAEFGETGSGWYKVPYTRNASAWTNVSAFLDTEQDPPHLIVAAGNGPSGEPATAPTGYLPATYMAVGKIATDVGPSGEELTPEVKTQYLVGDAYRALDEFRPYKPFEIRAVWDETENASIPLVYLPLVYIDGELATIDNTVYGGSGSEWYEIDTTNGPTGNEASVTAYIKLASDGNHVKVSTATTAPTGFTDDQIDVGDLALDNGTWKATEQYQVGAVRYEESYPLRIKIAEDSENTKVIYLPSNAVTVDGSSSDTTNVCTQFDGDWYEIDTTADPGNVYLNGFYYWYELGGLYSGRMFKYIVSGSHGKYPDLPPSSVVWPTGTATLHYKNFSWMIGKITGSVCTNFIKDAITVTHNWLGVTSGGGGSGGGGAEVTVTEDSSAAADKFVSWDSGAGPTGTVAFKRHSSLAASAVILSDTAKTGLETYLKGGAEDFGTNINSENFDTQCLAPSGDLTSGEESKAARSDHKHWVTDIYATGETGEPIQPFSTADFWNEHLRKIGVLTDPSATGAPEDDQTVTFGDITEGVDETMGASGIGASDPSNPNPTEPSSGVMIIYNESDIMEYLDPSQQGEWDRDTDTEGKGFKYCICSGISFEDGLNYLVFREITVDRYGMIRHISKGKYALQIG